MKYKAFVFDCDGTLTSLQTWKVVPSAAKALKELQALGYPVILATGRPAFFTPSITEAGIKPDYLVASNGHVLADKELNTIWSVHFDADLYDEINEFCKENELGLFWKFEDGNYIVVEHPNIKRIFEGVSEDIFKTSANGELPNSGALVGEEKDRELFMSRFAGRLECVNGGLLLYDINKLGVSKKNGLEKLLNILDIKPEEIMAFGDSENDIEMLDYAGCSVVLGDGMDIAKEHADYITDATIDDGVLNALKHFEIL